MKIDVCLIVEATVICLLAVVVVAPPVSEQSGQNKVSEPPTGNAGPPTANKQGGGAGAPTSPSTASKITTISPAVSPSSRPYTKGSPDNTNCTTGNTTECNVDNSFGAKLYRNKGMLQRAVYVLVGVTVVILIYFGLRTWSTRKRRSKAKKYGLITTPASDLEMAPLDQEDDDEDMTVFEVNGLHK